MGSIPVLARIVFDDAGRGDMDVENALDAFDTPAQVETIDNKLREILRYLRSKGDAEAAVHAETLRQLLSREPGRRKALAVGFSSEDPYVITIRPKERCPHPARLRNHGYLAKGLGFAADILAGARLVVIHAPAPWEEQRIGEHEVTPADAEWRDISTWHRHHLDELARRRGVELDMRFGLTFEARWFDATCYRATWLPGYEQPSALKAKLNETGIIDRLLPPEET